MTPSLLQTVCDENPRPIRMRVTATAACVTICVAIAGADVARAQSLERGKDEYLRSCQPCHGATGTGDGPNAKRIAKHPADLTRLSASNGGVFPFERVFEAIDGRLDVALHGPREMPVWGDRYKRDVMSSVPTNSVSDEMANILARNRILQLIEYISTLQSK